MRRGNNASSNPRRKARLSEQTLRQRCRRLLRKLGPAGKGKFVAIEMRTGTAYLGTTSLEAVQAGLRDRPAAKFFIERLGYRAAATLKRRR